MTDITAPVALKILDFHGSKLATFEADDQRWIVMRPVVEGMGLDWASQFRKLTADPTIFNCCQTTTVGGDGRAREMLAMPLRMYPIWLASISPKKVKDLEVRCRVMLFREMSVEALYQFWTTGSATMESVGAQVSVDGVLERLSSQAYEFGQAQLETRSALQDESKHIRNSFWAAMNSTVTPALAEMGTGIKAIIESFGLLKTYVEEMRQSLFERDKRSIARDHAVLESQAALTAALNDAVKELNRVAQPTDRVTMRQALEILGVPEELRTAALIGKLTSRSAAGWYADRHHDWRPAGQNRAAAEFDPAVLKQWWAEDGKATFDDFFTKRGRRTVVPLRSV